MKTQISARIQDTPKGWGANLRLHSGSFAATILYFLAQKKTIPATSGHPSLHKSSPLSCQGACLSSSEHWLSSQRMSQMASTNGPQEPIEPRKGIAKATMPSTIPIAPITWTCDNKIQVSYFVVVPSNIAGWNIQIFLIGDTSSIRIYFPASSVRLPECI